VLGLQMYISLQARQNSPMQMVQSKYERRKGK